jgi:hypothetical protein
VARAIGGVAAALVVAAVVLGASPRIAYCASGYVCPDHQHTMLVTNKSNVPWDVDMDVWIPGSLGLSQCPRDSDQASYLKNNSSCKVARLLQPGQQAGCSAYGTPSENHASVQVHFVAYRHEYWNNHKVWDITFDMAAGRNVELGLAPDGKATLDCGNIHYWTYDTK